MQTIYHVLGFIVFWAMVLFLLLAAWDRFLIKYWYVKGQYTWLYQTGMFITAYWKWKVLKYDYYEIVRWNTVFAFRDFYEKGTFDNGKKIFYRDWFLNLFIDMINSEAYKTYLRNLEL